MKQKTRLIFRLFGHVFRFHRVHRRAQHDRLQRHAGTDPGPDQHREPAQRRGRIDGRGRGDRERSERRRTAPVRRVDRVYGDELQHRRHQLGRQNVVCVLDRERRTTVVRQRFNKTYFKLN